jgi:hypothetical protein
MASRFGRRSRRHNHHGHTFRHPSAVRRERRIGRRKGCARSDAYRPPREQPAPNPAAQPIGSRGGQPGSKIAGREPVWIHPDDAVTRGIETGDVVCLFNLRGSCLAGAMVTPAVRAGVVQLATGAWFDPEEPGVPGSLERQGNPNVLTRDTGTSRLAQGPTAQSCLVEITKRGDAFETAAVPAAAPCWPCRAP